MKETNVVSFIMFAPLVAITKTTLYISFDRATFEENA